MKKNYNSALLKFLLYAFFGVTSLNGYCQTGVGIGTTTPQAALDVTSSTGGFLPPRMSFEQRGKLSPLLAGLIIYQEDNIPGLYLYNGASWIMVSAEDNLGNHNATQRLNLQDKLIVGTNVENGQVSTTGLRIDGNGQVGIGTTTPTSLLQIGGKNFAKPSFMKIGAGSGSAQREWELGVTINTNRFSDVSGENFDFAIRDATENATRLLIDYGTGNVGIGNSNPVEKLDVTGNAKVSNRLQAKELQSTELKTEFVGANRINTDELASKNIQARQYMYANSQSRVMVIPGVAFTSGRQNITGYVRFESKPGQTPIGLGVSLIGGTAGSMGHLVAPVILPDSAIITGLTLFGVNRHGAGVNTSVSLTASKYSESASEYGYSPDFYVEAILPNTNDDRLSQRHISVNHVVNSNNLGYVLTAALSQNSSLNQIMCVKIHYTVKKPD